MELVLSNLNARKILIYNRCDDRLCLLVFRKLGTITNFKVLQVLLEFQLDLRRLEVKELGIADVIALL